MTWHAGAWPRGWRLWDNVERSLGLSSPLLCWDAALAPTGTLAPEDKPPVPKVRGEREPVEQEDGEENAAETPRGLTLS